MTKRRNVTLDLDGTLLPGSTAFAEILGHHGREADVAASDAKYFSGEISLRDCFFEQWAWVQALTPADLHRALRQSKWIADLEVGLRRLEDAGYSVRLLTDQPSSITDFAARWGLEPAISSPVTIREGRQESVDYREDKAANLHDAGLDASTVIHVGNGSNDVPVWHAGAYGIAVFADAGVAEHAQVNLGSPNSFTPVVDAILALD